MTEFKEKVSVVTIVTVCITALFLICLMKQHQVLYSSAEKEKNSIEVSNRSESCDVTKDCSRTTTGTL